MERKGQRGIKGKNVPLPGNLITLGNKSSSRNDGQLDKTGHGGAYSQTKSIGKISLIYVTQVLYVGLGIFLGKTISLHQAKFRYYLGKSLAVGPAESKYSIYQDAKNWLIFELLQQLNFKKLLQSVENRGINCLLPNDNYKYPSNFLRKH